MHRILLRWRGITIYSYSAMLWLGIALGLFAQDIAAKARGLDSNRVLLATLILLVPALAGSRLFYVALNWPIFRADPTRILVRSEGGAALYGGLVLTLPLSVPVLAALKLPLGTWWDTASFTMLIGVSIGRVGCLLNGCCTGRPSSGWFAVELTDWRGVRQRRFPTQVIESAWSATLLLVAIALWRLSLPPGRVFLATIFGYGVGRYVMEGTREWQDRVAGVSVYSALSLALAAGAALAWVASIFGQR